MTQPIEWQMLRDTACGDVSNGSGFHHISEAAWKELADALNAKATYPKLSTMSIPPLVSPPVIAKAAWIGDPSVLPEGTIVDILSVDEKHDGVPARAACWIRWIRDPGMQIIYRSCDLSDLDIDEKTIGRDKNIFRLVEKISGVILLGDLPRQRWSCSDDESGTILTMNRQRRWTQNLIKDLLLGKPVDVAISRPIECVPIDDDFDQAARFYAAQALGSSKEEVLTELKRRYNEEEILDQLVYLFALHRTNYS